LVLVYVPDKMLAYEPMPVVVPSINLCPAVVPAL
jgi:hypothetical protein